MHFGCYGKLVSIYLWWENEHLLGLLSYCRSFDTKHKNLHKLLNFDLLPLQLKG